GHDETEEEEKDEAQAFDTKFLEYQDLAGQAVKGDDKDGKEIPPTSPLVQAKDALRKPRWTKVESLEWTARTLGPNLMIKDMMAEHQGQKKDVSELGEKGRAFLYYFPGGYVERAVIHIFYKKDELTPDDTKEPFTIISRPFEGQADMIPGYQEIDVH